MIFSILVISLLAVELQNPEPVSLTQSSMSEHGFNVDVQDPRADWACHRVQISMPETSGGDEIKEVLLIVGDEDDDVLMHAYLESRPSPVGITDGIWRTSFCLPSNCAREATVFIRYGNPSALCIGDTFRIDIRDFITVSGQELPQDHQPSG